MLEGKAIIITGAGAGIGKATAAVCAREGARVLAVDFSGAQSEVAEAIGPAVTPFQADVREETEIEAMFARALELFGRVDGFIHSAGTMGTSDGDDFTLERYEFYTGVHLRGTLLCAKHAVRAMVAGGGGAIVNVSSVGSLNAEDKAPISYSAAKAAMNNITQVLAVRYGPQGIRANVLAPGFTFTEFMEDVPKDVLAQMAEKTAIRRYGQAVEQAEVAAFLVSDRSSYLTGAVIPVDGGWSARMA